jgi:RHS repeat-associated protein
VTDTYEYEAFGNSFTVSGSTPNNYLYRGEQFDPDLGLYYLRARYYNPATGRFMSRDPEDGQFWDSKTLHKYLYAAGDPVNASDPTGRGLFEYLFARRTGILNSNAILRVGLGWNNIIKCVVFRIAIGSAGAAFHFHFDLWDYCAP